MRTVGPVAVYRQFDASGDLLYIGQSSSPTMRPSQIAGGGASWVYSVANITVEWFPDREQAMAAEALAIKNESPRHNITHSTDRAARLPRTGGNVLRHWLSQRDVSEAALAKMIGKPVGWVRKVANDEISPAGESSRALERMTGISPLVFCRAAAFPRYASPESVERAISQMAAVQAPASKQGVA